MWLFALILGLPLVEISLYVTLGAWLGLWLTLTVVVGTALLGLWLIRRQGARAQSDLRAAVMARENPAQILAGDALVLVAGVLLVLPGFLTDFCGLILLLPPVQRWISAAVARRARDKIGAHLQARAWKKAASMATTARRPVDRRPADQRSEAIDGTWEELPDDESRPPSGWTRH